MGWHSFKPRNHGWPLFALAPLVMGASLLPLQAAPPPAEAQPVLPATLFAGLKLETTLSEAGLKAFLTGNATTLTSIRMELARLKEKQSEALAQLRQGNTEDERALQTSAVTHLRSLARDPKFQEAYQTFTRDALRLLETYGVQRKDERERDWRMAGFRAESLGTAIRSYPDAAITEVHVRGGGGFTLGKFLTEFQPILARLSSAGVDHVQRVDAAEAAARAVTPSLVVPVAARAIRVRDLEVLHAVFSLVNMAYLRLLP